MAVDDDAITEHPGIQAHVGAAGFAVNHIGAAVPSISRRSTDQQIGKSITVNIAGTRNAGASLVIVTVDSKATGAKGSQVHRCCSGFAKDHYSTIGIRVANHEIGESITIDISSASNAPTVVVTEIISTDMKTAIAVQNSRKLYRASCLAQGSGTKDNIGASPAKEFGFTDNQIGKAITINIASTGDTETTFGIAQPPLNLNTL